MDKAEVILLPVMTEFRLSTGPICIAITKEILNQLSLDVRQQSTDSNMLYKTDAIRGKIAEVSKNDKNS